MARRQSTAAVIRQEGRILLVKRSPGGDLGDCWELPGGKVDDGETPEQALRRELMEELGLEAVVGEQLVRSGFHHRGEAFDLLSYRVTAVTERIELREHVAAGWFTIDEALQLDRLAPSDRPVLENLGR